MTIRQLLAAWLRQWADRLDPYQPPVNIEFVQALKREAAEFGMAGECAAIKDEIDRGLDTVYRPKLTIVGKRR